jgi:hypothetical protein
MAIALVVRLSITSEVEPILIAYMLYLGGQLIRQVKRAESRQN